MAELLAKAEGRAWSGTHNDVVALATTSSHFPTAISELARATLIARPSPFLGDLLAVTADARVQDYNEQGYGLVDIALEAPDANSGQRYVAVTPHMAAQPVQLFSTFGKLVLTIQAITNDDYNFLPSAVAAFANSAARAEMQRIADLLEANLLPDGSALFAAGNSNTAIGTVSAAGLGTGMALLRAQPTEGQKAAGAPTKALMCHPDAETAWLAIVETLPQDRQPRVVANPFLSNADAWYAFGDPAAFPCLARVLMVGADPSAVSVSGTSPANFEDEAHKVHEIPGFSVDVTHTVGIAAVSPIGIAKLTLSQIFCRPPSENTRAIAWRFLACSLERAGNHGP